MPMKDLEAHLDSQHASAFETLTTTLKDLTRSPRNPVHPSVAAARDATEAALLDLVAGLQYSHDLLTKAVRTPSLPLLMTLCENPEWRAGLDRCVRNSTHTSYPHDFVPYETASADYLVFLWEHGFALNRADGAFGRRYLYEESTALDPIARATFPGHDDPLLGAMTKCATALWSMTPGRGLRHLHTLERLVSAGKPDTIKRLHVMAGNILTRKDWRSLSLLLWMGLDLSAHAPLLPPTIADLFALSGTNHGRLRLRTLEPDIADLAGRALDAPRFGLTIDQAQQELKILRAEA